MSTMPKFMSDVLTVRIIGKGFCKNVAEKQLGLHPPPSAYDVERNEFKHKVFVVPSQKPILAVSAWCGGERFVNPNGTNQYIQRPMWGCSIYPRATDHVVMYHYLKTDEAAIIRGTRFANHTDVQRLQGALSRDVLEHLEGIIVSAPGWDEFPPKQQEKIRAFFQATPDRVGLEIPEIEEPKPIDNWHSKDLRLINLFSEVG